MKFFIISCIVFFINCGSNNYSTAIIKEYKYYLVTRDKTYECIDYWMLQKWGNKEATCTLKNGEEIHAYGDVSIVVEETHINFDLME